MSTSWKKYFWVLSFLIIAGLFSGCAAKRTPPGDSSVGGMVEGAAYSYHYWAEGLNFLIWHDLSPGSEGCSGTGSTEDPLYRLECQAEAQDGRSLDWVVHTTDGITAEMWIDGQKVDLSQGNMFLIRVVNGDVDIVQLEKDLSGIGSDNAAIEAIATDDLDVAAFVEQIGR